MKSIVTLGNKSAKDVSSSSIESTKNSFNKISPAKSVLSIASYVQTISSSIILTRNKKRK